MPAFLNTTHLTNMASGIFTSVSATTTTIPTAVIYTFAAAIGVTLMGAGITQHRTTTRQANRIMNVADGMSDAQNFMAELARDLDTCAVKRTKCGI